MTIEQENISSSGFITSSFENISDSFTDFSEIPSQGFNQLFKAKRHGQWFVLKGLKPEYQQNTLYKELLSKEYDLGIQFKHPHIIQTFNKETRHPIVGPCLVMEYVDGCTLKEFLKRNPSRKKRLKIVREILSALSYFHSLQIIHRDLKPENIMITHNGNNVKIIDFGLADNDMYAVLKQPAGTNKYMPPEQISGDVPLDCRADIYAFGIILRQIFPNEFGAIYRKATQKNREKRFDNAEEIANLLVRRQYFKPLLPLFYVLLVSITIGSLIIILNPRSAKPSPDKPIETSDTVRNDSSESNKDSEIIAKDSISNSEIKSTNKALETDINNEGDKLLSQLENTINKIGEIYNSLYDYYIAYPNYQHEDIERLIELENQFNQECSNLETLSKKIYRLKDEGKLTDEQLTQLRVIEVYTSQITTAYLELYATLEGVIH